MKKIDKTKKQKKTKQLELFKEPKQKRAHGGSLAVNKRRARRPLNLKQSHHLTMKSHHAIGARSLFRYKKLILGLIKKNALRFHIKVYEYAIQGNHLHLLVKAQSREGLQNFFRVVAGHVAQMILKEHPLSLKDLELKQSAGGAPTRGGKRKEPCKKNQRKFWSYLLYSRIVTWGREFRTVMGYIQQNTLELLQIVAYEPRSHMYQLRKLPRARSQPRHQLLKDSC